MKISNLALAALAFASPFAGAHAITFDLGGNGGNGTDGNKISFNQDGLTVTASAWNSHEDRSTWYDRTLGQWGSGLGVGGDERHTVDNVGGIDYVLFEFSEAVNPLSLFLRSEGNWGQDTDIQFWVGSAFSDNDPNTTDFTSTIFSSFIYGGISSGGWGSRWANLNTPLAGTALLVGANLEPGNSEDSFKIKKLSVDRAIVPDSSTTLALLALGLAALAGIARHYKN